jgi:hypothetical protein
VIVPTKHEAIKGVDPGHPSSSASGYWLTLTPISTDNGALPPGELAGIHDIITHPHMIITGLMICSDTAANPLDQVPV